MKKFLKRFWVFIPLILAAAMFFLLPYFPGFTEYVCSRGLFKIVTYPLGFITSLIPISLTELAVVLALPVLIFVIVLLIVKLRKSKARKKTLLGAGKIFCGTLSIACLIYMICHGANFYRYPLEKNMDLDTSQKDVDQLYAVCVELAKGAAAARAELETPDDELYKFSESIYTELMRTSSGYDKITEEYGFLKTSIFRQKPVMLSGAWSYTGIVGMYFPFFAECNINTAQPDYAIPFTAAHESAHSRGIAFENECNFLAFLSCINSEYPEFRYSGYMEAYKFCANELLAADPDLWGKAQQYCTNGMRLDFLGMNEYIDDHKGEISEVSGEVNDTFITIQGVPEGSLSYNRMTELVLAYYQKLGII
ncbi:MAG: DUF3810 domain-containing protein [Oscillospiraceae bacterium]|nr:DUF3810 domain-containing protein [Oscillospiraceae bacterium]